MTETTQRATRRLRRLAWLTGVVAGIDLAIRQVYQEMVFEADEALTAARQQSVLQ